MDAAEEALLSRLFVELIRFNPVLRSSEGRDGVCAAARERRGQKVRRDQDRRAHRVSKVALTETIQFTKKAINLFLDKINLGREIVEMIAKMNECFLH